MLVVIIGLSLLVGLLFGFVEEFSNRLARRGYATGVFIALPNLLIFLTLSLGAFWFVVRPTGLSLLLSGLGILSMAVANYFYVRSHRIASSAVCSLFYSLEPLIVTLLAGAFLAQQYPLTGLVFLAVSLVIVGLLCVVRGRFSARSISPLLISLLFFSITVLFSAASITSGGINFYTHYYLQTGAMAVLYLLGDRVTPRALWQCLRDDYRLNLGKLIALGGGFLLWYYVVSTQFHIGLASALSSTSPLFLLLGHSLFGSHRPTRFEVIGFLVAALGVSIINLV